MLEKCLHGKTQNANESFNGMVWNRVPKATHEGWEVLSVGVSDAIIHFNYGEKAALDITELLKLDPGYYMVKSCRSPNMRRKRSSIYRIICSCHVRYVFQSESTLYSCLNVRELLARSRREIWSLIDCNWTRTHNHLVHKRTLNHLVN